jgi:hypothetical protein
MDSSKFSMKKTKVDPMLYARLKDKCELNGNSIVAKKIILRKIFIFYLKLLKIINQRIFIY